MHSFMMATSSDLNAQENIAVMHFMESEVLKLAQRKYFAGILTTNTSPLTQVGIKYLISKELSSTIQYFSNWAPMYTVTRRC